MVIEPAHVDQIRRARNGRMIAIDADVAGVVADLQAIDPGLGVRFAEAGDPPYWCVYYESPDRRQTYLILTAQAHQTASGTWTGLDQRIVDRVRQIDREGRGGYDYAREIQRVNEQAARAGRERFRDQVGSTAEQAAHAVRKDLGTRYRGRAFVPKDIPGGDAA